MDVAGQIVEARRRAGLTQAELAERAGTSQPTLSAYESGRKDPSASTFVRILAAAGTRLEPREMPPVRALTERESQRRGRILEQVIGLAEALPYKPSREIEYPPIGRLYRRSADRKAA